MVLAASCLDAQPGKKSQLGTVTQIVGPAKIEIVYRRPVARGRELFGKLVVFSAHQPVFHLVRPEAVDEVLRVKTKPREAEHMETPGFYFPMVDDDSATLNMHWGRTVVPIHIKAI
jgi:hypothetical protein